VPSNAPYPDSARPNNFIFSHVSLPLLHNFVHAKVSKDTDQKGEGWQKLQFAAFVSSIIEQGYDPEGMGEVRGRLRQCRLAVYDCLNEGLMDVIATWEGRKLGRLK
jgi:S-(hydroxymethyl)glutathione synthase